MITSNTISSHYEHSHHEFSGKIPVGYQQKIYLIDNIDCANCAVKIEHELNEFPEFYDATLTFATKQLKITRREIRKMLYL